MTDEEIAATLREGDALVLKISTGREAVIRNVAIGERGVLCAEWVDANDLKNSETAELNWFLHDMMRRIGMIQIAPAIVGTSIEQRDRTIRRILGGARG